jgi:hypothetical protein
MNKSELASLRRIVDYMTDAEKNHYEESTAEEKKTHIYTDVLTLAEILDEMEDRGLIGEDEETE